MKRSTQLTRPLLSTSSVATLIVAGLGATSASAACTDGGAVGYTNPTGTTISCLQFTANSAGAAVNAGTITPGSPVGIIITSSTFNGSISNTGTISAPNIAVGIGIAASGTATMTGGITNSGTLSGGSRALFLSQVGSFSGGITNSGTVTGGGGLGQFRISLFTGGIFNSGSVTAFASGISALADTTFSGGVTNTGTISARTGISSNGTTTFLGGITNSGTITGSNVAGIRVRNTTTFSGGITNTGSISNLAGLQVTGGSLFSGGIFNSGSLTGVNSGVGVTNTTTFTGGVTNTGTISAKSGINVNAAVTFQGGITNSGSITGANLAGIRVNNTSTFVGGITNTGAISNQIGILVAGGVGFSGPIDNSGNVTGTGGTAIDLSNAPNAITVNQIGGTVTGATKLSANADILNITGGVLNGNIVGAGSTNTVNFAPTSGTFTYASSYSITGVNQLNFNSGLVTLNGANAATNVAVNAGTLVVGDASNTGATLTTTALTVASGATLSGSGTVVGNTTINGGTLAPGNSIGLLTVQGNLVFTAASSYMVEVSPASADRTNVTGTATLGGATVNASFAAGTYVEKKYTILNAVGGVSGTFNGPVNTNLPTNFKSSLSYDANNAYLDLALAFIAPPGTGLNINQQNVGNAIVNFFNTTGGIPLVFGGLTPAGLSQISGETATGSQQTTFNAMNQFMIVMTDPFIAGRGDPFSAGGTPNAYADESLAYAAKRKPNDALAAIYTKAPPPVRTFEQRWSVWAAGYGGSQTTSGDPRVLGTNDTRSSIYGTAVGADYRFSPNTLAGFALAGGGTNFSVNGFGSGRSDLFQAGAFIRHNMGPAYITGALAYGWQDVTTDRVVTVAGIDRLRAQFNANAWSGRVEGGYRFVSQGFGWTPYAAGQFTTFDLPAYAEQAIVGANTFALAYNSKSVTDTRSELGLRTDKSFAVQDGIFTLRGRAAWAHDFNRDRLIGATFQTLPGASFIVNGAQHAADSALVTGSAEMKWINGWSISGTFEGEFSNVTQSYAGKGVVRYAW